MIHHYTLISQDSLCFPSGDVIVNNNLHIFRSLYHITVRIISRVWGLKYEHKPYAFMYMYIYAYIEGVGEINNFILYMYYF